MPDPRDRGNVGAALFFIGAGLAALAAVTLTKKKFTLTLAADRTTVAPGDLFHLVGKLLDQEGKPLIGQSIDIVQLKPTEALIRTVMTVPTQGEFGIELTLNQLGSYSFVAEAPDLVEMVRSNVIGVNVAPFAPVPSLLTLQASKTSAKVSEIINLSGKLTDSSGKGVPGTAIELFLQGIGQGPVALTDIHGSWVKTVSFEVPGSYTIYVAEPGGIRSSGIDITISEALRTLTLQASTPVATVGDTVEFTGTMKANGALVPNEQLFLFVNNVVVDRAFTNNIGDYRFTRAFDTPGSYQIFTSDNAQGT